MRAAVAYLLWPFVVIAGTYGTYFALEGSGPA
jgi:hypothetical protein